MHTTMEKGSFTIGSNELSKTIISLKANSRMIKDLNVHSDATIEFTSLHAAKVTVGEEEYDLTFCDVKPTVCGLFCSFEFVGSKFSSVCV